VARLPRSQHVYYSARKEQATLQLPIEPFTWRAKATRVPPAAAQGAQARTSGVATWDGMTRAMQISPARAPFVSPRSSIWAPRAWHSAAAPVTPLRRTRLSLPLLLALSDG